MRLLKTDVATSGIILNFIVFFVVIVIINTSLVTNSACIWLEFLILMLVF
ncbi:hypothetical protein NIES3974_33590 [Calothrix sp. NIES-3974]|nr:hypothetical protein NIES3974_33590 [Calothrix sp. NIES-3974]